MSKQVSDHRIEDVERGIVHTATAIKHDGADTYVEFGNLTVETYPGRGQTSLGPATFHSDLMVKGEQLFANDRDGHTLELQVI